MKAVRINEHGGIDKLIYDEIDEPSCPPDKVKIQVKAAALNHLDILVRNGLPSLPIPLPLIMGSDASGTIVEVASQVNNLHPGDDVVIQPGTFCNECQHCNEGRENYCSNYGILGKTEHGTMAEYIILDPVNVHKKPEHLSFSDAASMQLVFMTAYQMLIKRGKLQADETVLIYGGSSGVGSAAIQICSDLGAKIIIQGNNSDEADEIARDYSIKNNIEMIHPFDDPFIIAGQGTIGLEILHSIPNVDTIIVPTSGGGLIGGIAIAVKQKKPNVKIIAVSMKRGPSMYNSLKIGYPVDVKEEETLADCLGGGIGLDNKYTFKIAQKYIDDFVLIDEDKIAEGIKYNFNNHKIVTEGAAATSIMTVHEEASKFLGKNILCLICGGNIDAKLFSSLI